MQDLATVVERVPLAKSDDGVIRVGGTRVTLETVVTAFDAGSTPEEIAQDYATLKLDDIYAVITYYLRHTARSSPTPNGSRRPRMSCARRSPRVRSNPARAGVFWHDWEGSKVSVRPAAADDAEPGGDEDAVRAEA